MFEGSVRAGQHELHFGGVTHVMGVINASPESKNAHTVAATPAEALELAHRYRAWGVDLIDVGGQSSHIDNPTIAAEIEIDRVVPVVGALAADGFVVSVDTWKPEVAAAAVDAGASIVNDTGGLKDADMLEVVASSRAAVVAVHVDGANPHAVDGVVLGDDKADVTAAGFKAMLNDLPAGVVDRVILDPGIAINYRGDYAAYTRLQLDVIRHSARLAACGRPLLIPIPRKQDIAWVAAYVAMALEYGADMIRVHDVELAVGLTGLWDRRVDDG